MTRPKLGISKAMGGMSWLALGGAAVLQLVAGVIRARAWFHVIKEGCPEASELRYRDVVLAQLGGCGWNAVLPAHAGDAVKVAIVNRRFPHGHLALLVATLVPPGLVEAGFTALLVIGLLATGLVSVDVLGSSLPGPGMVLLAAGVAGLALVLTFIFRRRLVRLVREVRSGLAVLGRPRIVATKVVPWLAAGRAVRLLAFALVLIAAGLEFGLVPALALMALQGAAPSAGAAATAARIALLATVLAAVGAGDVPATRVAEALAAAYGVTTVLNLAVSVAVIAWLLRTASPRRIVGYARTAMAKVKRARSSRLRKPAAETG